MLSMWAFNVFPGVELFVEKVAVAFLVVELGAQFFQEVDAPIYAYFAGDGCGSTAVQYLYIVHIIISVYKVGTLCLLHF